MRDDRGHDRHADDRDTDPTDDDLADLLAARRAKAGRKRLALGLALGGAAVVLAGVLAAAVVVKGRAGRGETAGATGTTTQPAVPVNFTDPFDGGGRPAVGMGGAGPAADSWTYKELFEYLERKGMKLRFANGRSSIYFIEESIAARSDTTSLSLTADNGQFLGGVMRVSQMPTAEAARQAAGRQLKGHYYYRNWVFSASDTKMLVDVRQALEN